MIATRDEAMSVPNLDCMDKDELTNLWSEIHYHPIIEARKLFPDKFKGYVSVTQNLGCYAINKATAISCRLRGDIPSALKYETVCDNIYKELPAVARW